MVRVKKLKLNLQTPKEYSSTCIAMTIQHRCPECGKIRKSSISTGVVSKITLCMNCGETYELRRTMHVVGLTNRSWHNANKDRISV